MTPFTISDRAPHPAAGGERFHGRSATTKKAYVCPMSDHPQEYDKPGNCPLCGMELVEKASRFRAGVLIFNHVEDIDFTAPIEVLGGAGAEVFTVVAPPDRSTRCTDSISGPTTIWLTRGGRFAPGAG